MIREMFGDSNASLFKLKNEYGVILTLTDIGASVVGLSVPRANGPDLDIALGYDDPDAYFRCKSYFGVTVGRYANRIGGGSFKLNGKSYKLDKNNNGNTLHGGYKPYSNRLWEVIESETSCFPGINGDDDSIAFRLLSPDGDQGFPGSAEINVRYTLNQENEVVIEYNAVADQRTVFNLTNHTYFNLGGHNAGSEAILDHWLELDCGSFTETDDALISTGNLLSVEGTPMDFRRGRRIGEDINSDYPALATGLGYDHNFVINTPSLGKPIARLWYDDAGVELLTYTDMPGIQFYSGNFMEQEKGKAGAIYDYRGAVCLETQFFPNSPNIPEFPSCVFHAGEPFISTTIYKVILK